MAMYSYSINGNEYQYLVLCVVQIRSSATKDEIIRIIADNDSRRILNSIRDMPKSATQISFECGIALYVVYRKLHRIENCDLVDTSISITKNGKKSILFQSKISGIDIHYHNDDVELEMSEII